MLLKSLSLVLAPPLLVRSANAEQPQAADGRDRISHGCQEARYAAPQRGLQFPPTLSERYDRPPDCRVPLNLRRTAVFRQSQDLV